MNAVAQVGSGAPNFDLASTEGVVIMLRDEVPRSGIVLYLFAGGETVSPDEDLRVLEARRGEIERRACRILAVSSRALAELEQLQEQLALGFPLLHDDRSFLAAYGVAEEEGATRSLVLVDREEKIRWMLSSPDSIEAGLSALLTEIASLPRSTSNYPRSILNRLVDRLRG